MLKSDYIVIKLSDVLENMEILSTTQGDEYECITIENLKGFNDIDHYTKNVAIDFAIYCSQKMWIMVGYKHGITTEELWRDFIKKKEDEK